MVSPLSQTQMTGAMAGAGPGLGRWPVPARPAARDVRLADELLLKVTPPRVPRDLVTRSRLLSADPGLRDHPVVLVQAPAGFGKTSLLAQWRREHLAQGAVVAWVWRSRKTARSGWSRRSRWRCALGRASDLRPYAARRARASGLEGITVWLAEVAQTAIDLVLFVDEADRLPTESVAVLAYLLRNAPPNLRVVVAARPDCHLGVEDLVAYGQCAVVTQSTLRFRFEETLELVHKRFGHRVDNDDAARLHELTEGWPLGLQLALAAIGSAGDVRVATAAPAAHGHLLREHFVALLLANLDPADVDFLTRIAILDHLHADLCGALVAPNDAAERLARMARDTPVFIAPRAATGIACTLSRATCCASDSPCCPPQSRPGSTPVLPIGWPRMG